MGAMGNVSRPLIGLLVATVAFFALWTVALKPGSSNSSSGPQGLGTYQSAITAAYAAVATSNAASAAQGGVVPSAPASAPKPATASASGAKAATTSGTKSATVSAAARRSTVTTVRAATAARHRLDVLSRALAANKVVALLFFNPPATDDQAVKQELAAVPSHGGKVAKLAVPLSELTRYPVVTNQVPVGVSPTLVLIDPDQQASTIAGFADRFEISQRVSDALRVR
jgi:hypothetical protein